MHIGVISIYVFWQRHNPYPTIVTYTHLAGITLFSAPKCDQKVNPPRLCEVASAASIASSALYTCVVLKIRPGTLYIVQRCRVIVLRRCFLEIFLEANERREMVQEKSVPVIDDKQGSQGRDRQQLRVDPEYMGARGGGGGGDRESSLPVWTIVIFLVCVVFAKVGRSAHASKLHISGHVEGRSFFCGFRGGAAVQLKPGVAALSVYLHFGKACSCAATQGNHAHSVMVVFVLIQ